MSTASAEPKRSTFGAKDAAGPQEPAAPSPSPTLSGCHCKDRKGWADRLESKLGARGGSLHPHRQLSAPLAQLQSVQTGFGSGLSWWDLTKLCQSSPRSITQDQETESCSLAGTRNRALKDPTATARLAALSWTTSTWGSGTLGAGGSVCRSRWPCRASAMQEVMRRDSSELAGRGRSFGAAYIQHSGGTAESLRASRRRVLSWPERCFGAKGEGAAFWK